MTTQATPAAAAPPRVGTWSSELKFLLKASRPGFWGTAAWFYLLGLGFNWPLHSPDFWLGLSYVTFGLGMLVYAANDLTDGATDRLNPRKDSYLFGARPTQSQMRSLPWGIALIQVPFLVLLTARLGLWAVAWFAAAVVASLAYNLPRVGAKDRPGWDVLAQVGYLLVFVLGNRINEQAGPSYLVFLFGALFAMHSHLFGQIMDIEPDSAAGRRTTAVAIGVVSAKYLIALLLLCETALMLSYGNRPWLPPFLLAGAAWFLLDARYLWRSHPYPAKLMKPFFLGWNLLLALEIGFTWLVAHGVPPFGLLSPA